MHVLHVLFSPSLGGLEQAFINITRALSIDGHRVTGLLRPDAPYRDEIADFAQDMVFIAPRGFYDVVAMLRIRKALKRLKPDMVLAHAPRAISLVSFAAMGLGIPVCGMLHSYRSSRIKRAQHLVVLTEYMRKFVVANGYPAEKVTIITNMIKLGDAPKPRALRSPLVIGALGRLAPEKGFGDLLDAVGILHKQGVPVQLVVGGKGKEEDFLRQKAVDNGIADIVSFIGWALDKEAFFASIDVFCLSSHEESFGIVLLEAMRYGVPIISTDPAGPAFILKHGESALMVPVGCAEKMAEAVVTLMQTPQLAQSLVEGAWRRVQDFRKEKVTRDWDALIRRVVSQAQSKRK